MKAYWVELRAKRDRLLAGSDWTQATDSPLTDEKKLAWTSYRKLLRDIPQNWDSNVDENVINPFDGSQDWSWPQKP